MKTLSLLSLLIFTFMAIVNALPGPTDLQIIDVRGYIDVPASFLQIRDDDISFERRDEIIRIETRGSGTGDELTKAGGILGKVGNGLSVASALNGVPVIGQALTVVKAAVAIFSAVLKAIGEAQHQDALKRGDFTQKVVSQTLAQHPGWNCIVVHTAHDKNFKGKEGDDWAHSHQELKVKFPVGSTIGFEIYTFREGTFHLKGDGGFLNWAYGGQILKGTAKEKQLTFGPSPQAAGSANAAIKGEGEQAAKSATSDPGKKPEPKKDEKKKDEKKKDEKKKPSMLGRLKFW